MEGEGKSNLTLIKVKTILARAEVYAKVHGLYCMSRAAYTVSNVVKI